MQLTLSQVAAALGVDLIGEDRSFSQISINTRTLQQGDLFIAIKGENFDAHDFLQQAEVSGACGLVVEQNCDSVLPQIKVKNSRQALGDIATLWASAFSLPIVAVTGSCGKTTVKEMTAAILAHGHCSEHNGCEHVLATRGNLNNDIGVPLTLLRLDYEHEAAVIELGANHIGEIRQLVGMVQPDVALITNVAPAHIEGFGSIEGVAQAKSEIYEGLKNTGTAIINNDDNFADFWKNKCQKMKESSDFEQKDIEILTFGLDKPADITAAYKQSGRGIDMTIFTPAGEQSVNLQQFGKHNVYNALAATAAALSAGCSLDDIKKGLESFNTVSGRLEQKSGVQGCVLFDDTYNANPGSVKAGIEAVQQLDGEVVLILGDMGELGNESETLHFKLGEAAASMGVEKLFTVGTLSQAISDGFNATLRETDSQAEPSIHFDDKHSLINYVRPILHKDNVVLVKGSRTMGMETIVNALIESTLNPKNKTEGTK